MRTWRQRLERADTNWSTILQELTGAYMQWRYASPSASSTPNCPLAARASSGNPPATSPLFPTTATASNEDPLTTTPLAASAAPTSNGHPPATSPHATTPATTSSGNPPATARPFPPTTSARSEDPLATSSLAASTAAVNSGHPPATYPLAASTATVSSGHLPATSSLTAANETSAASSANAGTDTSPGVVNPPEDFARPPPQLSSSPAPVSDGTRIRDHTYDFDIDVVDMYSLARSAHVQRDATQTTVIALAEQGYLASTPVSPTLAITFNTLEHFRLLRLRKPSFSLEAFAKVLCDSYAVCWARARCIINILIMSILASISPALPHGAANTPLLSQAALAADAHGEARWEAVLFLGGWQGAWLLGFDREDAVARTRAGNGDYACAQADAQGVFGAPL